MTAPKLSIVDSIFKGVTHGQARKKLVLEFQKRKRVHCQIIEHLSHAGVPDLDICINGVVWNLEIKVRTDILSDVQRLWLTSRLFAGGKCAVVHWKKGCITIIDLTQDTNDCQFRQDLPSIDCVVNYFMDRSEELKHDINKTGRVPGTV